MDSGLKTRGPVTARYTQHSRPLKTLSAAQSLHSREHSAVVMPARSRTLAAQGFLPSAQSWKPLNECVNWSGQAMRKFSRAQINGLYMYKGVLL